MLWVLVTAPPKWVSAVLCWRPLVFIGQISYGLYLWHFALHIAFEQIPWLLEHPVAYWTAKAVVPVAAASASYFLVERPIMEGWKLTRASTPAQARAPRELPVSARSASVG